MLSVTILGNNSAVPAFGRNPTSQVVQTYDSTYLIDCGEGTQMQMSLYKIRRAKISHIFISHLHGDHYFGLVGLLTSMSLLGRIHDVHLFAPKELEAIINRQFEVAMANLSYKLIFHPVTGEGFLTEDNSVTVHCFKMKHRIPCWGYLFKEKGKRNVDVGRAKSYEVPLEFYPNLQNGEDYVNKKGTIIPNEEVTFQTPKKTYAFCSDTVYDESLVDKIKGVDLLYHETTYLKAYSDRALLHFHSTTEQAATIAKKAGVKKLIIGHFSSKYEVLDEFQKEASETFPNTELALQGVCFKI